VIEIPDNEIENFMKSLEISKDEAIELWLSDHDFEENEEQENLDKVAKNVKIDKDIIKEKPKRTKKVVTHKVSDEKKELFQSILTNLTRCGDVMPEDITVLNENKLISVRMGEKIFKIDIIEQRPSKKTT
jgi:ribosomal protein L3